MNRIDLSNKEEVDKIKLEMDAAFTIENDSTIIISNSI